MANSKLTTHAQTPIEERRARPGWGEKERIGLLAFDEIASTGTSPSLRTQREEERANGKRQSPADKIVLMSGGGRGPRSGVSRIELRHHLFDEARDPALCIYLR